jgi:two-component system chemotaxis response regulator CheB
VQPIRVMVVDDSLVVRRIVSDALSTDPAIQVVGTAVNGLGALAQLDQLNPDLVTMDMQMPEMSGIEAVRALRARRGDLPIIMFCSATERGAAAALDALAAGANDYVTKPARLEGAVQAAESVRRELVPRIKALTGRSVGTVGAPTRRLPPGPARSRTSAAQPKVPAVLVIAASTGGPQALATLVPDLPASLPVPVLVVQHMPPVFTRQFAERLDRLAALQVREAEDGGALVPGVVHVAPGDFHMTVRSMGRRRQVALDQAPPENFCRPSADRLFRSAGAAFHGAVLAVVLTGMGSDGRAGAAHIRGAGGTVLVQDRATSVVWGMPGVIADAGLADEVVPLAGMADAICRRLPQLRRETAASLPPGVAGAGSWR